MYGEKGYVLIKELSRCKDSLPPYNNDLIKEIQTEITDLIQQNLEDAPKLNNETLGESSLFSTMLIRHAAVKRNVRCLMAYHYNRLKTIRRMRWEFGSILPADIKRDLSAAESEWFSKYSRNLVKYMKSLNEEGFNLAENFQPPKELFIEVICLVDYGKYELEDGSKVLLKKHSRHFLPRNQCELLIRQGIIQHVE